MHSVFFSICEYMAYYFYIRQVIYLKALNYCNWDIFLPFKGIAQINLQTYPAIKRTNTNNPKFQRNPICHFNKFNKWCAVKVIYFHKKAPLQLKAVVNFKVNMTYTFVKCIAIVACICFFFSLYSTTITRKLRHVPLSHQIGFVCRRFFVTWHSLTFSTLVH